MSAVARIPEPENEASIDHIATAKPSKGFERSALSGSEKSETERGTTTPDDDDLRCAACGHRITSVAYRIEMNGAHEHTFVNPGGFVHHIGCYAAAPGCIHVGHTETAFSWFPGWSWQIAACGQCRAHLGWIFRCAPDQFHGLIVAALRM